MAKSRDKSPRGETSRARGASRQRARSQTLPKVRQRNDPRVEQTRAYTKRQIRGGQADSSSRRDKQCCSVETKGSRPYPPTPSMRVMHNHTTQSSIDTSSRVFTAIV